MSLEFVALSTNSTGATLIFTEIKGAGSGVPFLVSSVEEASGFLAIRTDRVCGIVPFEEELAIRKGAISLGLVEPSEELRRVLKLRRAIGSS